MNQNEQERIESVEDDLPAKNPAMDWPQRYLLVAQFIHHGALFSGFYAIVASMNGDFVNAAVAIFISMILMAWMAASRA